jgi:methionyl-tRNA formyltransferase
MLFDTALFLAEAGNKIAVIVTAPAAPESARKEDDFKTLAQRLDCPFFLTRSLNTPEVIETFQDLDLGISVNWISIVSQEHINCFSLGILNAHFGDLPRYRGNASPNWAILQGENELVLSIHSMEGGLLDYGRVIIQNRFPIDEETTIAEVYEWAEKVLPNSFLKAIELLQQDPQYAIKYADPDDPNAFRCYPRLPEDGFIDWSASVESIHRLIRAAGPPFRGAYTYHLLNDTIRKLYVFKSRIVAKSTKDLAVAGHILKNDKEIGESWVKCGDGIMALQECRYSNERENFMPGKRWKSIRMRLGIKVEDYFWNLRGH